MIISILNHTRSLPDESVQVVIRAINKQLQEDFKPYWYVDARLRLEGRSASRPDAISTQDMRGSAVIYLWDELDVDDALGYHALNHHDVPFGFVFTELSRQLDEPWSVTLSHEALEMALDPEANGFIRGPHPEDPSRIVLHWREACDAVQTQIYEIDGVEVSNFLLRSYFTAGESFDGRNDFLGMLIDGEPLKSFGVAPGGYIGYVDPVTGMSETYTRPEDSIAASRKKSKYKASTARRAIRYARGLSGTAGGDDDFDAITVKVKPKLARKKAFLSRLVKEICGAGWSVVPVPYTPSKNDFDLEPPPDAKVSPKQAWEYVYALRDNGSIVRAEPAFDEPVLDVDLEEGGALTSPHDLRASGGGDKHHPDTDRNYEWSVKDVKANLAWKLPPRPGGRSRGEGVRVGHPDSGFRRHNELDEVRLDMDAARDFVDDDENPVDAKSGNHGLSTASVIMSGESGSPGRAHVTGTAPLATLVPLRVTKKRLFGQLPAPVLFKKGARRLRDAIHYAIFKVSCQIISISLGSKDDHAFLREAVDKAQEQGVIVLAAAGNRAPIVGRKVIYPAKYGSVIAVAATNYTRKPWKDSARGRSVDVAAPGESVFRARIKDDKEVVSRSHGTSYAVATTAGVAALWWAHLDVSSLIKQNGSGQYPRESVALVFKKLLESTCDDTGWDPTRYGAGIIDAKKLLEAPLPPPPSATELRAFALRVDRRHEDYLDEVVDLVPSFESRAHARAGLRELLGSTARDFRKEFDEVADELLYHLTQRDSFGGALAGVQRGREAGARLRARNRSVRLLSDHCSDRLYARIGRRR